MSHRNPPRKFVAYLRHIVRSNGTAVAPKVEEQRKWIRDWVALHPDGGKVVGEFTEYEIAAGLMLDTISRPSLGKAIACALENKNREWPGAEILFASLPHYYRARLGFTEESRYGDYKDLKGDDARSRVFWTEIHEPAPPPQKPRKVDWIGRVRQAYADEKFSHVWEQIESDCSDYLSVVRKYGKTILFCCVPPGAPRLFFSPPQDKPLSSVDELILRGRLYQNMGLTKEFRQSEVTMPNFLMADRTAKVHENGRLKIYAFFPCNGFRYAWPRNAFSNDFLKYRHTVHWEEYHFDPRPHTLEERPHILPHKLWRSQYIRADLLGAFKSGHKVLIHGAPFWCITWDLQDAINEALGFRVVKPRRLKLLSEEESALPESHWE